MKKTIILVVDILLRIAFTIFGVYLLTKHSSDSTIKFAGLSIIVFNLITTFFDSNYHKIKSRPMKTLNWQSPRKVFQQFAVFG